MTHRRVIFLPADYFTNPPKERIQPVIDFEMNIDPNAQIISPSTEPDFIYTSPKPGLEGIGIVINDRRLGPFAVMLSPAQAKFVVDQVAEMLNSLDTIRLEHDYHRPGDLP